MRLNRLTNVQRGGFSGRSVHHCEETETPLLNFLYKHLWSNMINVKPVICLEASSD